jgi:hypothetical protein
MATHIPLFVICDRCRTEGLAGEDPFLAFGALLDFEPVPRRARRADGWDSEVQRAYIAALSLTGTDRAACRAVGKSAFGVTQLLDHEGSEGFRAARDEALSMAADERSRRLAEGVRAVAAEQAGWRPPAPPWSRAASRSAPPLPPGQPPEDPDVDGKEALRWLERMLHLYLIKLESERSARLEGHVAAADLYVRQATAIEVMMDLAAAGFGLPVFEMIGNLNVEGVHFIHVAETPFSRLLDEARRGHWQARGEPARPEPPSHLFKPYHGVALEPCDQAYGGRELSLDDQWRAFAAQHARDAEALIEWEARARQEASEWRARVEAEETPSPFRGSARDPALSGEGRADGEAPPSAEGEGAPPGEPGSS